MTNTTRDMSGRPASARALITAARDELRQAGVDSAALEARLLLAYALGIASDQLLLAPDMDVPAEAECGFREALRRRLTREPLFYILGEREFYGLALHVDSRALIPRPETELLVEETLAVVRAGKQEHRDGTGLQIADIGTGSGCVVVALATQLPGARFTATDLAGEALEVAAINAERHGVADRITFAQGDLLAPLPGPMHIIVANPPYVPQENLATIQAEIRDHEPRVAVDGGNGGMTIAGRLIAQAPPALRPGGWLFMEVGYGQASVMVDAAQTAFGPDAQIDMAIDLAGVSRVVRVNQAP